MDLADKTNSTSQQARIPLFLLDAQHPWLVENQQALESLSDPETFLHSAPGTRHGDDDNLIIPQDLFHHVRISNSSRRPGWPNALDRLREMRRCPPAALARVRSLRVDVWVHQGPHADEQLRAAEWAGGPTDELVALCADVLAALPALEALTWGMPPEFAPGFRDAFEAGGLRLRSVVRLEPGPGCEFLVGLCPDLRVLEGFTDNSWSWSIEGDPWLGLVRAGAAAPGLTRFAVWAKLGASLVEEIFNSMPHLTSLALDGSIPARRPISYKRLKAGERSPPQDSIFKEMLVTLARFTRLRTLELPAPANLGFVVPAGRMCGTPMGWKQERAMTRQYFKDIDRVASLTVEFVPWLEELRVDRREAAIAHDQDGGASAAWPWSGRLEEHLEDIMPDYKRS